MRSPQSLFASTPEHGPVCLDELAVTIEDLAGNDCRRAVLALEAEEHVAVDVALEIGVNGR